MSKTLLTVGTRKGAFVLESEDRRDWTLRGPYCEGWPVYHAIYDETTGSIHDVPWEAVKVSHIDTLDGFDVQEYQVVMRGKRRRRRA